MQKTKIKFTENRRVLNIMYKQIHMYVHTRMQKQANECKCIKKKGRTELEEEDKELLYS